MRILGILYILQCRAIFKKNTFSHSFNGNSPILGTTLRYHRPKYTKKENHPIYFCNLLHMLHHSVELPYYVKCISEVCNLVLMDSLFFQIYVTPVLATCTVLSWIQA